MANKVAVCGICDLQHITKPSVVWCPECDEGLCLDCNKHHGFSKATRNHSTIPISKYETLPTNVLEISQFCSDHEEKFQIYCKKHDRPCCSKCIVSDHQKCQNLIQLDVMTKNVKTSYGFHDIEQAIIDMVGNIERIKKGRQGNVSSLKNERKLIENEINETKAKIVAKLDELQGSIMKELYEAESKESKTIGQLLDSIEKNEKEIRKYQENLVNIKQHASDLQTFLAMKQMERDVAEKDHFFSSLVKSNKLNVVSLSFKMNDALQNICNEIQKYGEVIIGTRSSELEIVGKQENRAQIVIAPAPSKSIDNISVSLQATIYTKLDDVRGCALLPDGRMMFSSYNQKCVRVFNRNGSQGFDISLKPNDAFDITYIHDNNTIAVTGGNTECISIIDLESKKVKETIPVGSVSTGIVSRNNTLIYCGYNHCLRMINLTDKSISNIITTKMSLCAYVATFGDKLYYTNSDTHTVTCCDLRGKTQWEFKDPSVLSYPQGISVDNDGNVYVVGIGSDNVVVISPDGMRHRQLLSRENGLKYPAVLHYDRFTNQLLVANQEQKAFLYKVE